MVKKGNKKNPVRSIPEELFALEDLLAKGDYPVRIISATAGGSHLGTGSAWNSLLCLCLAFIRVKPWKFISMEPNFFIESPFYPEPCVGNIMGQGGQSFGLILFPSEPNWDRYMGASSLFGFENNDVDPVYELSRSCSWLSVDFVSWRELSSEGRAFIEQTTWNGKTANGLFPDIYSHRAGYTSRIPNVGEVLLLDRAVRSALLLAAASEAGQVSEPEMMQTVQFDERFTLELMEREGLTIEGVVQLLPSQDPVNPSPPMSPDLDSVDVSAFDLSSFQVKSGVVWELAVERMGPAQIVDPITGAVTIPRIVVVLDATTGFAFPPAVISPDENPVPGIMKVVMDAAETAECLPEAVHVRDEKLCDALVPLMGEYGVRSVLVNSLVTVDNLLEGIELSLSQADEESSLI